MKFIRFPYPTAESDADPDNESNDEELWGELKTLLTHIVDNSYIKQDKFRLKQSIIEF